MVQIWHSKHLQDPYLQRGVGNTTVGVSGYGTLRRVSQYDSETASKSTVYSIFSPIFWPERGTPVPLQ